MTSSFLIDFSGNNDLVPPDVVSEIDPHELPAADIATQLLTMELIIRERSHQTSVMSSSCPLLAATECTSSSTGEVPALQTFWDPSLPRSMASIRQNPAKSGNELLDKRTRYAPLLNLAD